MRFFVGTRQEDALVKVYSKLYANLDRMPPGASPSIVKARSIDDVPILALTLWGENYDAYQLRQMADELEHTIKQVDDVSETTHDRRAAARNARGAGHREARRLRFSPDDVVGRLQAANARIQAGEFAEGNQEIRVDAGNLFHDTQDLESVVLGVATGGLCIFATWPISIVDGPADPQDYVLFGIDRGACRQRTAEANIPPSRLP